jgi:hypothetical protein
MNVKINRKMIQQISGLIFVVAALFIILFVNRKTNYYGFLGFSINDTIVHSELIEKIDEPYNEFPSVDKNEKHLIYNGFIANLTKTSEDLFELRSVDVTTPLKRFEKGRVYVGITVDELKEIYSSSESILSLQPNEMGFYKNGARLVFAIEVGRVVIINISSREI